MNFEISEITDVASIFIFFGMLGALFWRVKKPRSPSFYYFILNISLISIHANFEAMSSAAHPIRTNFGLVLNVFMAYAAGYRLYEMSKVRVSETFNCIIENPGISESSDS